MLLDFVRLYGGYACVRIQTGEVIVLQSAIVRRKMINWNLSTASYKTLIVLWRYLVLTVKSWPICCLKY